MKKIIIDLINISKKYSLHHEKTTLIENIFSKKSKEELWALKNINLTIRQGERVGIIGPNGAGKSTLLKTIVGITSPTLGKVVTHGKIVSLMNLQAGFHPELTGRENINFNGMLAGMNKDEIRENYDNILEFSGLNKFIDEPFFTYSDGMKFRLAFSIAIHSNCDILIMDEVFLYGDLEFQRETIKAVKNLQNKSVTTIIASQIPSFVWGFSNLFYEMESGVIRKKPKKEMLDLLLEEGREWYTSFNYPIKTILSSI